MLQVEENVLIDLIVIDITCAGYTALKLLCFSCFLLSIVPKLGVPFYLS